MDSAQYSIISHTGGSSTTKSVDELSVGDQSQGPQDQRVQQIMEAQLKPESLGKAKTFDFDLQAAGTYSSNKK